MMQWLAIIELVVWSTIAYFGNSEDIRPKRTSAGRTCQGFRLQESRCSALSGVILHGSGVEN
jgi:hypothetical protein